MKKYFFTIPLLILLSSTSCEKLLEVDLPQNQISSDKIFESPQTAYAALASFYAGIRDESPISGEICGELYSSYTDELSCFVQDSNSGLQDIALNTQQDSNFAIYLYWAKTYEHIYKANAIIEGVDNSINLSITDKKRIKGEALLLRSLLFFYLQQTFGDIPLVLTTSYQINQSIAKSYSSDVLSKLNTDLSLCIDLLTDDYRSTERVYPNKKVAQLILAKVLMSQNKWNEAEVLLRAILQNPLYQFQTDISKVFNKSSTHILWQIKPQNSGDPVQEATFYYFNNSNPNTYALTNSLVSSFSNTDARKQNWITTINVGSNTWYRPSKYKNLSNNSSEYSIVFRLEEVYLLLAESLAFQNKVSEAIPFVNATRLRAQLTPLSATISQSSLQNEILEENKKEFFTEMGHRFLDLKRQNKLNDLLLVKPNWKPFHNLWPLPQKELLANPNLNPQNVGY